ncbi:hypothetical protein [Zavarzinia aquatilis]|uniref:hypothetical protein n=1 Tax=Zavarzinia aquatilis TaxID=2211142 RepID=UPI00105776FB|nr:hypothetical protein [Zavarzinia aquatilis]
MIEPRRGILIISWMGLPMTPSNHVALQQDRAASNNNSCWIGEATLGIATGPRCSKSLAK